MWRHGDMEHWPAVLIAATGVCLFAAASLYIPLALPQAIAERIRSRAGRWLLGALVVLASLAASMLVGAALGVGVAGMILVIGSARNDKALSRRRLTLLSIAFGIVFAVFAFGRIEGWVYRWRNGGAERVAVIPRPPLHANDKTRAGDALRPAKTTVMLCANNRDIRAIPRNPRDPGRWGG